MADNTSVVSSRVLAREESVQYIRSININLTLNDARPNTRMYVFFGDEEVTSLCGPNGQPIGTSIFTNAFGQASINLAIPGGKFTVGAYEIMVADTNILAALDTNGSVYGSARGMFTASGKIQFFQETQTTINRVERVVEIVRAPVEPRRQPNLDPIAQSFFTFGVAGGMFLTSIDLFFQTKDTSIPVSIELRELINGFPSVEPTSSLNFIATLPPALVSISSDGSLPTKFEFSPPVYLRESGEFCFVVRSNSNQYNLFTSKMGEPSFENGTKIFQNPYVGSLFKSENNITWSAEQSEDVKFVIRKAVFQNSGTIDLAAEVPPVIAYGNQFSTTTGSNIIRYESGQEHGLEVGSKMRVIAWTQGTYNGIPGTQLNALHTITSVVDRNVVEFTVASNASASGAMNNSNGVINVMVKDGGSGYSIGDTISFSGVGSGAVGTLNIINGVINSVTMTNVGSGYLSVPTITINTSTGTGAQLVPMTTPSFTVYINKPMSAFKPGIKAYNFGSTKISSTLDTTIGNYDGGTLTTYSPGKEYILDNLDDYLKLDQSSVIASTDNEEAWVGGKSTRLTLELQTDNPNLSPVVDLKSTPEITAYYSRINAQPNEDVTSDNSSASVTGTISLVGGSNYTQTPVVTISPPDYIWGTPATATATRSGGSVNLVTITQAGSGYTSTPLITITRGAGDTTGSGASVQAVISSFNTELLPAGGLAKARYMTGKTSLKVISTGIRLLTTMTSVPGASVDWYIRPSLSSSGVNHESLGWQRMICFEERNKSAYVGELFEYEFGLDGLSEFDTYDLKCVLLAQDPTKAPIVTDYRVIVLA